MSKIAKLHRPSVLLQQLIIFRLFSFSEETVSLDSPPPESLSGGSGAMNNLGEILSQVLPDGGGDPNKAHGTQQQQTHAALSKTTSNDVS